LHCAIVTRAAVLMFPLLLQTIISNQMRPRMLRGAWFSRLLQHPARRQSGSILSPGTHTGCSRLRQMLQMLTILTDVRGVCLSVCLSVTRIKSAAARAVYGAGRTGCWGRLEAQRSLTNRATVYSPCRCFLVVCRVIGE